jgi:hypothetical protein
MLNGVKFAGAVTYMPGLHAQDVEHFQAHVRHGHVLLEAEVPAIFQ